MSIIMKPGDWKCIMCAEIQFARNERCRRCNRPRPQQNSAASPSAPPQIRKGDWICVQCNDMQFASRVNCRKCGASKPVSDDNASADNNTACMICMERERNASLLHGDSVHVVCCLECGRGLVAAKQPCPLCRQPIENVLKTFQ